VRFEEAEEAGLVDYFGNSTLLVGLLVVLLLLDFLFGGISAFEPLDVCAFALLNDVQLPHVEGLLEFMLLKIVVLFELENQVKAEAFLMLNKRNVDKMHQNRSVLLLNGLTD